MNFSTKLNVSILSAFLLSACGGNGGGSSPISQPISPNGSTNSPPNPQVPIITENPQSDITNNPSTPPVSQDKEVSPTQPKETPQSELTDKIPQNYTVLGDIVFNPKTSTIIVNEFKNVEDTIDKTSGKLIIQSKNAKEIPLSSITLTGVGTEGKSDYQIHLLTDDVFYGYYANANRDFTVEASDRFNQYFAVINNNKIAQSVPIDLTATYQKENGFFYGSNYHVQDFAARITKSGKVDIRFENGNATGSIIDSDYGENEKFFEISGDTKRLILEPTENNVIIQAYLHHNDQHFKKGFEKAVMDITFIDSTAGAGDQKYLTGTAHSDMWSGVLAAEKQ